ncbi:uncharacterized protein LOC124157249 isoform X2 [Ischnura elegans]|uniref:uncharacterized protein LOC124157249 isoform X2 n=1 Tax=Ischnura elegans TaxID=197161 RepID=UPI001ED8892F|nr:uncharacterized protein LOC124157249 isoform X2 [Ischnura elegans]
MGRSHVKYVTILLCMATLLPIYFAVPLDTSSQTTTSADTSTTEATKGLSSNNTKGFNTTDSSEESSETVDILLFPATVVKEFQILEIFGFKNKNSNSTESSTTETYSTDKP